MDNYFLATSLPDLQLEYPPELSFHEFEVLAKNNLSLADYEKLQVMRRYYDIENIRAFWKKEELDYRGNFDENELEEALLTRAGFPGYVYDYLEEYDGEEERIRHFPELIAGYFHHEIEQSSGFLRDFLEFEREWRLVLVGFRAKKLGRDVVLEMQYEDPNDDFVAQIIAQKDAKSYEPPDRYGELKALFEEHFENPLELHKALCEYRFRKLDSSYGVAMFSLDRIMVYMAQLIIAERWMELDRKKGMEIVDNLVKEAL